MENITSIKNIDQNTYSETERKFVPYRPETLKYLRQHETVTAIEQLYLSTPDEPYSLRLRSVARDGEIHYEATLKDCGVMHPHGLRRLEVNAPISPEVYEFYAADSPVKLLKLRAEPIPEVIVDFYEDGSILVESENEEQFQIFQQQYKHVFREVTGLPEGDNELRAYNSISTIEVPEVAVEQIVGDVLRQKSKSPAPLPVHIGGRSGSGKSTIVNELKSTLETGGVSCAVLSTDDYHRGDSWLRRYNSGQPWQRWDEPIVYDLKKAARDIESLRSGVAVAGRKIDWETVEPYISAPVAPADVIIVEGIYATSSEIAVAEGLLYELPTPLATCTGRRILRDIQERPQFVDPAKSLAYILSEAEPAYRRQRAKT